MKINYTGVLFLVIIFMLRLPCVSAQSDATGKTESTESKPTEPSPSTTLPPNFPKCITSCLDDHGLILPSGDYAYCDDCNAVAKCTYGRIDVIKCPFGTVYYDRVLGVCVKDSTVCINDSYVFTSPTGSVLTTAATAETASTSTAATAETTSTTATAETSSTSTSPIPTTVAITSTSTAQSTTSPVVTSQIYLSSTAPTTAVETTTDTAIPATTTTTASSTTTTSSTTAAASGPTTIGNIPTTGPEAESLLFVMDFYNRFSSDKMRSGVRGIKSVTKQQDQGTNNDTGYMLYGVTLASSSCPNTSENMGADNQKCPPISAGSGQSSITECSFKVNYNNQTNANKQLDIVYMMCYQ